LIELEREEEIEIEKPIFFNPTATDYKDEYIVG